jgi:hypothetical protein
MKDDLGMEVEHGPTKAIGHWYPLAHESRKVHRTLFAHNKEVEFYCSACKLNNQPELVAFCRFKHTPSSPPKATDYQMHVMYFFGHKCPYNQRCYHADVYRNEKHTRLHFDFDLLIGDETFVDAVDKLNSFHIPKPEIHQSANKQDVTDIRKLFKKM